MPIPTPEQIDIYETASSRLTDAIKGLNEAQMHYAMETCICNRLSVSSNRYLRTYEV
jgi:hypothetical protein